MVNHVVADNVQMCNDHYMLVKAMSTTDNALTAHVVIDDEHKASTVRKALKEILHMHGITHAMIESESGNDYYERDC